MSTIGAIAVTIALLTVGCSNDTTTTSTDSIEQETGQPGPSPSAAVSQSEVTTVESGADAPLSASADSSEPGVWVDITPPVSMSADDFGGQNFGVQTIAIGGDDPSVMYVGTCYQGIWRSTDRGESWTKTNTGVNGANLDTGRNWTLAVDPSDSSVLYTVAGYGAGQGLWKSVDGGVGWAQTLPDDVVARTTADIYSVAIDPDDPDHLLVGSHSGWGGGPSGVLESPDGGVTWRVHPPQPSWGTGHYVFFITSDVWLLGTQDDGYWRTADAGSSWTKVSEYSLQHGGGQIYRASDGALYVGALGTLLRSADEGASWEAVGPPTPDGYNAIIGDGSVLYALAANTGANTVDPDPPYSVSPEADGRTWTPLNGGAQTFIDGPMAMAFDPIGRIVYSANWRAGVWRLNV